MQKNICFILIFVMSCMGVHPLYGNNIERAKNTANTTNTSNASNTANASPIMNNMTNMQSFDLPDLKGQPSAISIAAAARAADAMSKGPCGTAAMCPPCGFNPCTGEDASNPCPISIPYPACLNRYPKHPCDPRPPCYMPPCTNPPQYRYPPCYDPKDAYDLVSIYSLAVCNDATLQAARQALLAAREAIPQANAQFLPAIVAQSTHSAVFVNGGDIFTQSGTKIGGYNSNTYGLSLTQPVLHFEHWKKYEQACSQVKQANATYAAAEQDLMVRAATAYFNVLQAVDTLYYATAQVNALAKFYDQTRQRFKVGLIAITDVQIAKAQHDSAVAKEIIARADISNKFEALREIIGVCVENLVPLRPNFKLVPPDPADMESWACTAIKQNFSLQAQRFRTAASKDDIKITEFGHLPTVDVLGSSIFTNPSNKVQFENNTSALTLQVTLPLFSGGSVLSKTRQARHTYLQIDKQTEALYRSVESNTRQFFRNVITEISDVEALKQAVISNKAALEATQASFNVGTRTIVDVLNAQTGYILAQLNLATSKYKYILQSIELKRAAGVLCPEDLCHINAWLQHGRTISDYQPDQYNVSAKTLQELMTNPPVNIDQDLTKGIPSDTAVPTILPEIPSATLPSSTTSPTTTSPTTSAPITPAQPAPASPAQLNPTPTPTTAPAIRPLPSSSPGGSSKATPIVEQDVAKAESKSNQDAKTMSVEAVSNLTVPSTVSSTQVTQKNVSNQNVFKQGVVETITPVEKRIQHHSATIEKKDNTEHPASIEKQNKSEVLSESVEKQNNPNILAETIEKRDNAAILLNTSSKKSMQELPSKDFLMSKTSTASDLKDLNGLKVVFGAKTAFTAQ